MADIFTPEKRSIIMSHIRSKNTHIEKRVFSLLRKNGVYYQKHYRKVAGNPDIALPRKKKAVFIDGDFWHGREFKKTEARLPQYWRDKISANISRDKKNRRLLVRDGWKVLRVWEHEIDSDLTKSVDRLIRFLR